MKWNKIRYLLLLFLYLDLQTYGQTIRLNDNISLTINNIALQKSIIKYVNGKTKLDSFYLTINKDKFIQVNNSDSLVINVNQELVL